MNPTVQAALTAGLANLTATTTVPEEPLHYGSDLWCESDLSSTMEEVDGSSALGLAQYCVRRLQTPNGLPDDGDWGIDLTSYCNSPTTRAELDGLEGSITAELVDDDRIDTVSPAVDASADGRTLSVSIRVVPLDALANEFSLTLTVSDIGILIEEMAQ